MGDCEAGEPGGRTVRIGTGWMRARSFEWRWGSLRECGQKPLDRRVRVFDKVENPSYDSGELLVRAGSSRQIGARVGFEVR